MFTNRKVNLTHYIGLVLALFLFAGCSLIPIGAKGLPPTDGTHFYEDFESIQVNDLPDGWLIGGSSSYDHSPHVVEDPDGVEPISGRRVLKVGRGEGESRISKHAYREFDPIKGKVSLSFWFYPTNDQRSLNLSVKGNTPEAGETKFSPHEDSTVFLTLNHGGSNIRFFLKKEGSTVHWTNGPAITPNVWQKITLDMDVDENKFDVYLNDSEVPALSSLEFANQTTELTGIALWYQANSSEENHSPVYIDDILIKVGS